MANLLYYSGHLVSIPMYMFDRASFLYPLYNWLMVKSADFDAIYETGVWVIPEKDEEE